MAFLRSAIASLALLALACAPEPGMVSIRFSWEQSPPADGGTYFCHVAIEERPVLNRSGRILGSAVAALTDPLDLALPSISNGDDRVAVVEIRDGADRSASTLRYF